MRVWYFFSHKSHSEEGASFFYLSFSKKAGLETFLSDLELNPVNICDDFQSHVLSAFSFDTGAL